jgi:hypothetical protein
MEHHVRGKVRGSVSRTRNIFYEKYLKINTKFKNLFKLISTWIDNVIKNPTTTLILKIHREFILARKIMKLVSIFSKIMLNVVVPRLKLFKS